MPKPSVPTTSIIASRMARKHSIFVAIFGEASRRPSLPVQLGLGLGSLGLWLGIGRGGFPGAVFTYLPRDWLRLIPTLRVFVEVLKPP